MWVVACHHRQPGGFEHGLDAGDAVLVPLALEARALQVPDRCGCGGADRRRQRGREDEAGSIAAHGIDQRRARRDVAAQAPECLGERALDHVDARMRTLQLGLAASARPVHSDRMHLVGIGHGAVAFGEIADGPDRRDVAVHGVERLEHDELRPVRVRRLQQFLEMRHVIVAEDLLLASRLPDSLDHGIVVPGVRQDQTVRA